MAAVVSLMAKDKGTPSIKFQLLLWPVTDANFESCVRGQQGASEQLNYSSRTMQSANIKGTPTVKLDGKDLEYTAFLPGELEKAILEAQPK